MNRPRSSQKRYRLFVEDYRLRRVDEDAPKEHSEGEGPEAPAEAARVSARIFALAVAASLRGRRCVLARAVGAGLEMVEPLFMRFIVDRVLLQPALTRRRGSRGSISRAPLFLAVIVVSNLISALKDYRQRLLNARVMLSLRRSLFDRLLHLPLPKLWEMKTGGILSRLTGDVDTTTGLLQMAIVSPAVSVIRLVDRGRHPVDAQLAAGADRAGASSPA